MENWAVSILILGAFFGFLPILSHLGIRQLIKGWKLIAETSSFMELDRDIAQSQFIFSEVKLSPFMTLIPSKNGMMWESYPLLKDQVIQKNSKIIVKPIPSRFVSRYKIFIASIGE